MSLPLDKQEIAIDKDSGKKMPALDPRLMEKSAFVAYEAPPRDTEDRGAVEEWLERLRFIEEDLHWLLQLPHSKFWCQVVFDEGLKKLIKSYLASAPRSYDAMDTVPMEARERQAEVHRLVFMTCLRMSTHKESKEHYLTPSVFGDILYENFLFDIPKLLDLCALYRHGNAPLLEKMVANIFTQQPKYLDDLQQTIPAILQILQTIQARCGLLPSASSGSPVKLSSSQSQATLVSMATSDFQDILFYLADTALTLAEFLDTYPPACSAFHQFSLLPRLASFYELVMPAITAAVKSRQTESYSQKSRLKLKCRQSKRALLRVFRLIVNHCCINPILEHSMEGGEQADKYVQDFIHVMSSVLAERRFLADYEGIYSFHEDAELLTQASNSFDDAQLQFIQSAINTAFATYGKRRKPSGATARGGRTSPDGSPGPPSMAAATGGGAVGGARGGATGVGMATGGRATGGGVATNGTREDKLLGAAVDDAYQVEDYEEAGACAPRVTGVELDSLISSVKDILPDLGEGFIELVLEEYGWKVEDAVHALLEDRLPQSLCDLDHSMIREREPEPEPDNILDQRHNVYDNDEFDVFHKNTVDTSKIWMGKKMEDVSLDDKADVQKMKATYEAYGNIATTGSMYDDYDDEYDDTYDGNEVGADDADSADELTTRRPFTTPRVLADGGSKAGAVEEDSASEEEDTRLRDAFVEDPARLRAQAEQRARTKAARQGRGHPQGAPPPRQHDVVGRPKGQGQDKDVQRNRRWKEQHKGGNRRHLADKKRMQ